MLYKSHFRLLDVQRCLSNLLYIVLWLNSNCFEPLSLVVMLFLFFDLKPNSLHNCFPTAIVIFLWCHQFGFVLVQYLIWLHELYVFVQNRQKLPILFLHQPSNLDLSSSRLTVNEVAYLCLELQELLSLHQIHCYGLRPQKRLK